ncbi:MAG: histidine phosphatase family protein [Campylobacterota bacterium]|nr:histidine phosphatase family protein [Campylobacterota bacterium]
MAKTIYLLRHFRVKDTQKAWLDGKAFDAWVDAYDDMELEYLDIELPSFDSCLVSPQNRAIRSAKHLGIEYTIEPNLHEVEPKLFWHSRWKLSKNIWLTLGRLRWLLNMSSDETRSDTFARVHNVIKKLQESEAHNILILSHGFFIKILARELRKEGFVGDMDIKPKNGKIYPMQIEIHS